MKLHVDLEAYWLEGEDSSDLYICDEVFAMIAPYEHCGDEHCNHCHRYPEPQLWVVQGLGSIDSSCFRTLAEARSWFEETLRRMFAGADVIISHRSP